MSQADQSGQPPFKRIIAVQPSKRRTQMGRPEVPINWNLVKLARSSGCNWTEVAATIGVHRDTIIKRAKKEKRWEELDEAAPALGRAVVKMKLREKASQGNVSVLIYLDKKATDAEAAASGAAPGGAATTWLVETRPQAASVEAWVEQYGPMKRDATKEGA